MPFECQLRKVISATPQLDFFFAEIDDHGVRRGDTRRILARWRFSVASRVALDLPYWEMSSASYRLIHMAFEMARKAGAFFLSSIICLA